MNPTLRTILKVLGAIAGVMVLAVIAVAAYVSLAWNRAYDRPVSPRSALNDPATVARGEFLYQNALTCWGCHAENAGDLPKGGRVFDLRTVGPGFGILRTPNITPDPETGIGSWSDGEIARAMREAINRNGQTLFLMPSKVYHGLSDDDTYAIISYLRSIPPVKNPIPPNEPSFVLKALYAFELIKPEPAIMSTVDAPPKGLTAEYGRYLAHHVSLCADCHTPRNLQNGEFYTDSLLAGSTIAFGDIEGEPLAVYARNITPDRETGIGAWTEEQFLTTMRVGMRSDSAVLSPHMPYANYGLWPEEDLRAIYVYLKTVPAIRRANIPPLIRGSLLSASGTERGKAVFETRCMACHGKEGTGLPATKVKLAEVATTLEDHILSAFITNGNIGLRMPAFGKTLTPEEIRDVVAYIRTWSDERP